MTDTGTTTYPINTADDSKFKTTSVGAADEGKIPLLDSAGVLGGFALSSSTANTSGNLVCGVASSALVDDWDEIEDGSFRITVDGTGFNVDNLDIQTEAPADMDAVATYLQAQLRIATSGSEVITQVNEVTVSDATFTITTSKTSDTVATSVVFVAQTFKAVDLAGSIATRVKSVDVLCSKTGSPGDLIVEIRETNETGSLIGTGTLAASSINSSSIMRTVTLDSPVDVVVGNSYCIIFKAVTGDASNKYPIGFNTANPYADGSYRYYNGSAWNDSPTYDVATRVTQEYDTPTSSQFIITSGTSGNNSEVKDMITSTGTVGTDISGLATPTWMNGSAGTATQGTSDHNKIPLLDSAGNIAIDLADGTGMATDAAPTADTDIANKKYVDDEIDTLETSTEAGYYMSAVYDNHTFEVNSDTHSVTITCGFRPKFIEVIGNIDGNNITRDYHDVSHALGESFAPSWYNVSADTYLGWENVGANEITSRTTGLFKAENPNDEFCEMRINNITDTGFDLYFVKTGSDSVPFYWKFLLKVQR